MNRKRSCRFGNWEMLVNRHSSDEQFDRRDGAIWMITKRNEPGISLKDNQRGCESIWMIVGNI